MAIETGKTCLGDGMVLLETEREAGTDQIYLEKQVWEALVKFVNGVCYVGRI